MKRFEKIEAKDQRQRYVTAVRLAIQHAPTRVDSRGSVDLATLLAQWNVPQAVVQEAMSRLATASDIAVLLGHLKDEVWDHVASIASVVDPDNTR